jgi:hypothetical protein
MSTKSEKSFILSKDYSIHHDNEKYGTDSNISKDLGSISKNNESFNDDNENILSNDIEDDEAGSQTQNSHIEHAMPNNFQTNTENRNKNRNNDFDPLNDEEIQDFNFDEGKISELLFCVQGIGKANSENSTIYDKGEFCEASLRDIHRFLRKDDPENPKCKYYLLNWKICENDIIPLMLNYNNDKIQLLSLVILVDVTCSIPPLCDNRIYYISKLTELQEFIANSNLINNLSLILADSMPLLFSATTAPLLFAIMPDFTKGEPKLTVPIVNGMFNTSSITFLSFSIISCRIFSAIISCVLLVLILIGFRNGFVFNLLL